MGTRRGRPEADDLLRMAEHRRSMHALRRAAAKAATEGTVSAAARPMTAGDAAGADGADRADRANVTDLADARARREGRGADAAHAH